MLLSLMYHHVNSDKYSNNLETIEKHFSYLSKNYKIITLKEKVRFFRTDLLLVFDDAFFDFYYYVFPLLKKYNLKAILSVPTHAIVEKRKIDKLFRLNIQHEKINYKNTNDLNLNPFCTWQEIREMSDSGYVEIASHGCKHIDLTLCSEKELKYELEESKMIIESKIDIKCDIFTYPYGSCNKTVREQVKKYYKYDIAIGSMYNYSINNTIYRVSADNLENCCEILSRKNKIKYFLRKIKYFL